MYSKAGGKNRNGIGTLLNRGWFRIPTKWPELKPVKDIQAPQLPYARFASGADGGVRPYTSTGG